MQVTRLVKEETGKTTLAIGDGANDVGMYKLECIARVEFNYNAEVNIQILYYCTNRLLTKNLPVLSQSYQHDHI